MLTHVCEISRASVKTFGIPRGIHAWAFVMSEAQLLPCALVSLLVLT